MTSTQVDYQALFSEANSNKVLQTYLEVLTARVAGGGPDVLASITEANNLSHDDITTIVAALLKARPFLYCKLMRNTLSQKYGFRRATGKTIAKDCDNPKYLRALAVSSPIELYACGNKEALLDPHVIIPALQVFATSNCGDFPLEPMASIFKGFYINTSYMLALIENFGSVADSRETTMLCDFYVDRTLGTLQNVAEEVEAAYKLITDWDHSNMAWLAIRRFNRVLHTWGDDCVDLSGFLLNRHDVAASLIAVETQNGRRCSCNETSLFGLVPLLTVWLKFQDNELAIEELVSFLVYFAPGTFASLVAAFPTFKGHGRPVVEAFLGSIDPANVYLQAAIKIDPRLKEHAPTPKFSSSWTTPFEHLKEAGAELSYDIGFVTRFLKRFATNHSSGGKMARNVLLPHWLQSAEIMRLLLSYDVGRGLVSYAVWIFESCFPPLCGNDNTNVRACLDVLSSDDAIRSSFRSCVETNFIGRAWEDARNRRSIYDGMRLLAAFFSNFASDWDACKEFVIKHLSGLSTPFVLYDADGDSGEHLRWLSCVLTLPSGTTGRMMSIFHFMPAELSERMLADRDFVDRVLAVDPASIALAPGSLQNDPTIAIRLLECKAQSFRLVDESVLRLPAVRDAAMKSENSVVFVTPVLMAPMSNRENLALALGILVDDRLPVGARRSVYNSLPVIFKDHTKIQIEAACLFGTQIDAGMFECPLVVQTILRIAHTAHSSDDQTNTHRFLPCCYPSGWNLADWMRSFLYDLQSMCTPASMRSTPLVAHKHHVQIFPSMKGLCEINDKGLPFGRLGGPNATDPKTINDLTFENIEKLCLFLDNTSALLGQIVKITRRDGFYPGDLVAIKFAGVGVKFSEGQLTSLSGKCIHVPSNVQAELGNFTEMEFVGILHAGAGDRSKAAKIANGTLPWTDDTHVVVYDTTGAGEALLMDRMDAIDAIVEEHALVHIKGVEYTSIRQKDEAVIVEMQKRAINDGHDGIVFCKDGASVKTKGLKFEFLQRPSYTKHAHNIIDFIETKVLRPWHVFEDMAGVDEASSEGKKAMFFDVAKTVADQDTAHATALRSAVRSERKAARKAAPSTPIPPAKKAKKAALTASEMASLF